MSGYGYGYSGYGDDMRARAEDPDDDYSPFVRLYHNTGTSYRSTSRSPYQYTNSWQSAPVPSEPKVKQERQRTWDTSKRKAPFMTGGRPQSHVDPTPEQQEKYAQFNQMANNSLYTVDPTAAASQEEHIRSKEDQYRVPADSMYFDFAPGNSTRHPPQSYSSTPVRRPGYYYPPPTSTDTEQAAPTTTVSYNQHSSSSSKHHRRHKGAAVTTPSYDTTSTQISYITFPAYQEQQQPATTPGFSPDQASTSTYEQQPATTTPALYSNQTITPAYQDPTIRYETESADSPPLDLPQQPQYGPTEWEGSAYSMRCHHGEGHGHGDKHHRQNC